MVFDRGRASQLHAGGACRRFTAHAGADLVVDRHLEERLELDVKVLLLSRPPHQPDDPAHEARDPSHQSSPSDADMIRAIASVCCCQSLVSRFSVARPCAVSE